MLLSKANKFYKSFIKYNNFFCRKFEYMAIGVVKSFDEKMIEELNDVLIVRYIKHLEMDCLELAVLCDCKEFISMNVVQRILTDLWKGNKCDANELVRNHHYFLYYI